jgi:hypothetical protein
MGAFSSVHAMVEGKNRAGDGIAVRKLHRKADMALRGEMERPEG